MGVPTDIDQKKPLLIFLNFHQFELRTKGQPIEQLVVVCDLVGSSCLSVCWWDTIESARHDQPISYFQVYNQMEGFSFGYVNTTGVVALMRQTAEGGKDNCKGYV